MSYRGRSVYCSFCGERGHNRTGCPKRKQYIKENPNSWEAIKEQRKQQKRDEIKAKGGRKCSYCGNRGHTTRTCEIKKQDRVRLTEVLARERTEGLKRLNEMGWGVGALFERKNRYVEEKHIYMVEEVDWERWNDSDIVTLVGLNVAKAVGDDNSDWRKPRQVNITVSLDPDDGSIKPLVRRHAEQKAPEGFLDGTMFDESRFFPKGMSRRYIHERIKEEGRL
tara:strand:+ start:182 stop:850 length:669 start_codon:yes stop_codon:yes gene_type:complete